MNKFLELITVPIAAGGQVRFELAGDYFEIIESQYPVTVLLEDRNGSQIGRLGSAEASYYMRDTEYSAITISSAQAQTVRIAYGSGEAGTRQTSGVVKVVDGEKSRVLANAVYSANPALSATNFATVQLWNPVGSGRNLIVTNMVYGLNLAGGVVAYPGNVQLTTDVTAMRNASMRMGGALGVAQSRTQDMATVYAYASGSLSFQNTAAGQQYAFPNKNPFVINPGFGLNVTAMNVGLTLGTTMIFFEEKI